MVLARAAFGRRGNYLPAAIQALLVIGWCAVNTWIILDLVMALFGTLGWVDPEAHNYAWKIGIATFIMAAQVAIAWFGYKAIAAFEKWTVPPTIIILTVMSAVAWFGMKINWTYAGPAGHILEGSGTHRRDERGHDGHRHRLGHHLVHLRRGLLPLRQHRCPSARSTSRRCWASSFRSSGWASWGPAWPPTPGRSIPANSSSRTSARWLSPCCSMVLHGPIATNILNIYTFSVATQALDISISRRKLNLFVGVFSLAAVIFFIFQEDFATVLDAWLIGLVAWVAAWGGVMLVHYFWIETLARQPRQALRRRRHQAAARREPGGMASFLIGIFATWLFMYGLVPAMQGPSRPSRWADGTCPGSPGDWPAAAAYAVLGGRFHRRFLGVRQRRGPTEPRRSFALGTGTRSRPPPGRAGDRPVTSPFAEHRPSHHLARRPGAAAPSPSTSTPNPAPGP